MWHYSWPASHTLSWGMCNPATDTDICPPNTPMPSYALFLGHLLVPPDSNFYLYNNVSLKVLPHCFYHSREALNKDTDFKNKDLRNKNSWPALNWWPCKRLDTETALTGCANSPKSQLPTWLVSSTWSRSEKNSQVSHEHGTIDFQRKLSSQMQRFWEVHS